MSLGAVRLAILLASSATVVVYSSDVNWGKKVPCFIVEHTVVCPGCNQRAGLSCPRNLKNSRNCLEPTTEIPFSSQPDTNHGENVTHLIEPTISKSSTESSVMSNSSTTKIPPTIRPTMNPVELALFLYRVLGTRTPKENRYRDDFGGYLNPNYYNRNRRDTTSKEMFQQTEVEEENEETCDWNGDCPCPLICCKTGPGCPKKCVPGIRLPPPWGK